MNATRLFIAAMFWVCLPTAWALDWSQPWIQLHDQSEALGRSDEYAWRLFVALNWPADPNTGRADPRATLGEDRPTVWECWENARDVYLDDGSDPGDWGRNNTEQREATRRFEMSSLKDAANPRHIVGGVMVPLTDALANARRLTEVRMDRASFDYIRAQELYNLDGQARALEKAIPIRFPVGATEVKAKWRAITENERSRYHTTRVRFADGSMRLYGLTALHVAVKDQANWFWATFEHVDNPSLGDNEGWKLPSRDSFACADKSADCNLAPSTIGISESIWKHYRLRGTLTSYLDAAGTPKRLANSELESGMQDSSSCMSCHARASLAVVSGSAIHLPIFDGQSATTENGVRARRGFIGMPQESWFELQAGAGGDSRPFTQLDFVWSLTQAQPRKAS